ncbi:MAG: ribosome biogenesis GTPase Der [Deltaproteobacteria bacterium]|jgi:GTP-binding protein|nr:ribosome biogenesis GTPase Der [Deltaproteobacteria bacterium]
MCAVIALVGRPNVGKSSLFNRLLKTSKALVDDMPGVTRDRHYASISIEDRDGILVDTGGFDFSQGGLSGSITRQVNLAIEESDLVVFILDGLSGLCPEDEEIARILRKSKKETLLVINKIDSPEKKYLEADFYALGFSELISVSAAHGLGIEAFKEKLLPFLDQGREPLDDSAPRLAVIGRPNAGKSSLINRLIGAERLVVDPTPGTTRDSLDVTLDQDGKKYILVDTAGVRRKGRVSEKIEKLSVMRALKSINKADVAILMVDATLGLSDQDAHIAGYAFEKGKPMMILLNKWDLIKEKKEARENFEKDLSLKMSFLEKSPWFTVSAITGQNLQRIFPLVDSIMVQYKFQASTSDVNKVLEKAMAHHSPPQVGKVRLKFYYATQVSTKPPTFVLFANRPKSVHFSYRRFLINRFKMAFGLDLVPARLIVRSRHKE